MSRSVGLLHAIGAALGDLIAAGRGPAGAPCLAAAASQQALGQRWLWTSAPACAAQAAAATRSRPPAAPFEPRSEAAAPTTSPTEQPESSTSGESAGAFSSSFRRVNDGRRAGGAARSLEGVVHIQNTFNNIILTLTDPSGDVKTTVSAGIVGFRGARKSQPAAAERVGEELARRALALGYGRVAVRLKGAGSTKQYAVQSMAAGGLVLSSLADVTPIAYNGCRLPRRRRV